MVLIFRVKKLATTSDSSVNVDLIADAIVSGGDSSLLLYRLNPVKAAKVGFQRAISILDSIGVYLPAEIKSLIESLEREYIDVYLTLESPDIIMYTGSSKFVRSLRAERLVIFDRKTATLRLMPKNLHRVLEIAERQGLKCKLGFELNYRASFEAHLKIELRDYQLEAYRAWVDSGYRGVVVLPVAAGKTMVALKAIEELGIKTLILVPTIDLLNQWSENIVRYLSISVNKIGIYGGGRRELNDVTIMTYDSAYINLERYPNLFGLVIADECHHAVSPSYRRALENLTAPYRMGLTATPYRSDGLHKHYEDVIGPIVYSLESESLQLRGYLARHREEKVYVTLPEEELGEYRRLMRIYLEFCRKRFPSIRDPRERFRRVLELASRDQAAREALRAKHRARRIALSNEKKIAVVEELLSRYKDEKILIFSRFTDIVREISRRFLIPRILHDTPDEER